MANRRTKETQMVDELGQSGKTPGNDRDIARETVKMMFEAEAIHLNLSTPFIFTSGWASPVYIDCRKLISYPRIRSAITSFAISTIRRKLGSDSIDCVVGGETAGIPYAAWVADRLDLPMLYVRKKAKGFGRNVPIEGNIVPGHRALLVEDLATDGASKVQFVKSLRAASLTVDSCFVVFYYDIFPESRRILDEMSLSLHYLATWWDVLAFAKDHKMYDESSLNEIEKYLHQPNIWSRNHGGVAQFGSGKAST
jgi:orotate phosphoribosyltransferase